jgi:hypothetical protein
MKLRKQTIVEKALDINLDMSWYGTFAEIGAGQEVARQFFQAGKASQTIALTISAYDMTFSDIIYGKEKNGRYVCHSRVEKMLDKEYTKLITRLHESRGKDTCFFSFADTVATSRNNSHGWMGVRFQHAPNAEPSEVTLHVRMLDKQRLLQQENLAKLGVNLIHCAFYKRKTGLTFLDDLFDQIKENSLSVDVIYFKGPGFKGFDDVEVNVHLLSRGWNEGLFINEDGVPTNPSDAFWGKNLLVQRAYFNPPTKTHLDVSNRGVAHFESEFKLKSADTMSIFEFTMNNRLKSENLDPAEAIEKVLMLSALKKNILITRFSLFYELKQFARLFTEKPFAIVTSARHLEKLFDEKFYFDLDGGLLEGMSKLLGRFSRLYIYPHKTEEICLLSKSFFPNKNVSHIYQHFMENKMVQDIAGCDEIKEFVHSEDIIKMQKSKNSAWKKHVPDEVIKIMTSSK